MSNFVPNLTQKQAAKKTPYPPYMGGIITHRPAIDWLTLTTSELLVSQSISRWIIDAGLTEQRQSSGGQGYMGSAGDGWFSGQAEKSGKTSYMTRFSGSLADWFMFSGLRPGGLDCTRIDIQLTLPTPYKEEQLYPLGRTLVEQLYQLEKARYPRSRDIDPILPPDGEFTIYLGSRKASSKRFTRFYVKPQEKGDWLLRFEVEFKEKTGLAGKVYRTVGRSPESMVRIIAGELSSWPANHPLISPFREHLLAVPEDIMRNQRTRTTPHKTLRWIAKQVVPAWRKVLGHHETRDRAMMLLSDLVAYAEGLDK